MNRHLDERWAMADETFIWRCPECNKKFRIKHGKKPPKKCPACVDADRIADAKAFDEYVASAPTVPDVPADSPKGTYFLVETVPDPVRLIPTAKPPIIPTDFMQEDPPRRGPNIPLIVGAVVGIVAVAAFITVFSGRTSQQNDNSRAAAMPIPNRQKPRSWNDLTADEQKALRDRAYSTVRKYVEESLKAPLGAKWDESPTVTEEPQGTTTSFKVASFVDAQNVNGVFLRLKFNGRLQYRFETDDFFVLAIIDGNDTFIYASQIVKDVSAGLAKIQRRDSQSKMKAQGILKAAVLNGLGDGKTEVFHCPNGNWSLAVTSKSELALNVLDSSGEKVGAYSFEPGQHTKKTDMLEGDFQLLVQCEGDWTITVKYPTY